MAEAELWFYPSATTNAFSGYETVYAVGPRHRTGYRKPQPGVDEAIELAVNSQLACLSTSIEIQKKNDQGKLKYSEQSTECRKIRLRQR